MSGASKRAATTVRALSDLDVTAFVAALDGVFEHSPWVAEAAWPRRPFTTLEALHGALVRAVRDADVESQLRLIRAHPELAGKEAAAGTLTAESTAEQASAGLDRCTSEEVQALRALNAEYRERFGFPFVIAVRGRGKAEILAAIRERLAGSRDAERERCLQEIGAIARLRLLERLEG